MRCNLGRRLLRRREAATSKTTRNKEKHKNGKGADVHGYIKTKLGSYFKTHLGITPLVRGVGKGGGLIVSTALGLYSEQREEAQIKTSQAESMPQRSSAFIKARCERISAGIRI